MVTHDVSRLTKYFIDYYAAHIADASRPFDGLETALDDLEAQGFRFAVCTNKLEWLSKLLLDKLDLSRRFAAICGADTFGNTAGSRHPARNGQARRRTPRRHHGDAGPDVSVARRAGIPLSGSNSIHRCSIAELSPDRVTRPHARPTAAVGSLTGASRAT
jgi:phosphoglycolate phosphatase